MKKLLTISAIVVFVFSLSSCAKLYKCKCSFGGVAGDPVEFAASNKKEARLNCEEVDHGEGVTCELQ